MRPMLKSVLAAWAHLPPERIQVYVGEERTEARPTWRMKENTWPLKLCFLTPRIKAETVLHDSPDPLFARKCRRWTHALPPHVIGRDRMDPRNKNRPRTSFRPCARIVDAHQHEKSMGTVADAVVSRKRFVLTLQQTAMWRKQHCGFQRTNSAIDLSCSYGKQPTVSTKSINENVGKDQFGTGRVTNAD